MQIYCFNSTLAFEEWCLLKRICVEDSIFWHLWLFGLIFTPRWGLSNSLTVQTALWWSNKTCKMIPTGTSCEQTAKPVSFNEMHTSCCCCCSEMHFSAELEAAELQSWHPADLSCRQRLAAAECCYWCKDSSMSDWYWEMDIHKHGFWHMIGGFEMHDQAFVQVHHWDLCCFPCMRRWPSIVRSWNRIEVGKEALVSSLHRHSAELYPHSGLLPQSKNFVLVERERDMYHCWDFIKPCHGPMVITTAEQCS